MILPREDELLPLPCSFLLWPAAGSTKAGNNGEVGGARGEAAKRVAAKGSGEGEKREGGVAARVRGGEVAPPLGRPPSWALRPAHGVSPGGGPWPRLPENHGEPPLFS